MSDLRLVRNLTIIVSITLSMPFTNYIFNTQKKFYILQRPPVTFYVDNLEPGNSYRIILFAVNAKGRSEPTIIDDITFKGVAKFTGKLLYTTDDA